MFKFNRRNFLRVSGASLFTPSLALSNVNQDNTTEIEKEISENIRHNVSSFRALNWEPYFKTLRKGAILVDISSRALHYWSSDEQTYRLFPSSVPMSDDLIKTGRTKVTRKVNQIFYQALMHDHSYQLHQTNSSHSGDNFLVKGKLQSYHQPPQRYLNFELLFHCCPRSYMHLKFYSICTRFGCSRNI